MANLYDLKKFDLNLLVIFECIYQHLSISKAAETLYITPSAVSQSLQRLRSQLEDPLFIRSGKGITPTTVGTNLHLHLEQNLNQIEQTINIMHGSSLKKNFIIYCPQLVVPGRLIEPLHLLFSENNYEVEQHDMLLSPETAEDLLAYRKADLAFTMAPLSNRSIVCTRFTQFSVVLVASNKHPRLKDSVTEDELRNEKFTFLSSTEAGVKEFRAQIETVFAERNIAFRSDSYISILNVISTSELIGYVPEPIFENFKDLLNLKKVEVPFELPEPEIFMLYNRAALNSNIFTQFIERIKTD